jgi:hypothetical protein
VAIISKTSFWDGNYIECSIEESDDVHLELCIVPTLNPYKKGIISYDIHLLAH